MVTCWSQLWYSNPMTRLHLQYHYITCFSLEQRLHPLWSRKAHPEGKPILCCSTIYCHLVLYWPGYDASVVQLLNLFICLQAENQLKKYIKHPRQCCASYTEASKPLKEFTDFHYWWSSSYSIWDYFRTPFTCIWGPMSSSMLNISTLYILYKDQLSAACAIWSLRI